MFLLNEVHHAHSSRITVNALRRGQGRARPGLPLVRAGLGPRFFAPCTSLTDS